MRDTDLTNAATPSCCCSECGYRNVATARICGLCSGHLFPAGGLAAAPPPALPVPPAPISASEVGDDAEPPRSEPKRAAPAESVREADVDLLGLDEVQARVRERCIRHGWTGVAIVFGLTTLFGVPASLHPVALLSNAIASVLFGFPLGFLASYGRLGMIRGALLGAGIGALFMIPAALLLVANGGELSLAVLPALLLRGVLAGIIPGGFIGVHVESDE